MKYMHMHHLEQFMKTMRIIHRVLPTNIFDAEGGIPPLQLEALLYLHMHPNSTVSALGKYLQLSSSATAQLTDRLAKADFIKRENNPRDRRSAKNVIEVTETDGFMMTRVGL